MSVEIIIGDMREKLQALEPESVDSCVTDPPYHLTSIVKRFGSPDAAPAKAGKTGAYERASRGFMGQQWDGGDVAFQPETWAEVYRVLKPGAHLVAFSGTRTYHRMACAIEDAGFEIRDQLAWVYGSGFPKSHDVPKGIDRMLGAEREVIGVAGRSGSSRNCMAGDFAGGEYMATAAATPEAAKWQGWGTALKPSQEPVCLARKPWTNQQEWITMRSLIEGLWSRLWLMLPANNAEQFSTLNPSVCGVDPSASAQWHVERLGNTTDASLARMDISRFGSAVGTALNTVSSWNATLAAACRAESTSTTGMATSQTTDLKTLRSCLSQITPESIILAHKSGQWSSAHACNVARYLNATLATLGATLELSALARAGGLDAISSPDAVEISPNWEPICLARKPLIGTVAANVLKHGTGAVNIDGCRVEAAEGDEPAKWETPRGGIWSTDSSATAELGKQELGRWPANIIHDGSEEVLAGFPDSVSTGGAGDPSRNWRGNGDRVGADFAGATGGFGDSGSAARFFYTAKASASERHIGGTNPHPTVKPIDLMRWLVVLVTPKGGTVLDPFCGSGSTLIAADREQFNAIGIEISDEYAEIARKRLSGDRGGLLDAMEAA